MASVTRQNQPETYVLKIISLVLILYLCLMNKLQKIGLDFEVDNLTNSIQNIVTGDSFATDITIISTADLKTVIKKNGWQFDWRLELKQPERDVYKLTIVNNQSVI